VFSDVWPFLSLKIVKFYFKTVLSVPNYRSKVRWLSVVCLIWYKVGSETPPIYLLMYDKSAPLHSANGTVSRQVRCVSSACVKIFIEVFAVNKPVIVSNGHCYPHFSLANAITMIEIEREPPEWLQRLHVLTVACIIHLRSLDFDSNIRSA
jgi:hypothetical protein